MNGTLLADLADILAVARGDQRTADERERESGKVVEGRGESMVGFLGKEGRVEIRRPAGVDGTALTC